MMQQPPPQGQSGRALSSKLIVDWSDDIIVRSEEPRESIAPVQDTADATTPRMQHNILHPENNQERERRPHNQSYKLTVVRCPKITSNRVDTSDVPRADKPSSRPIADTKSSPGELSNQKPTAHHLHRNNSKSVRDKSHTSET